MHRTAAAACCNAGILLVLDEVNAQQIRQRISGVQIHLGSTEDARNFLRKLFVVEHWHHLICPGGTHLVHLLFLTEDIIKELTCKASDI